LVESVLHSKHPCLSDFKAKVFLHPDLNKPEILAIIMKEFGLNKELQGLDEIRIINDLSEHYRLKE